MSGRGDLDPDLHGLADELAATPITKPTHTFDHTTELDLGGRVVELVHPGRGHTDHDVLVVDCAPTAETNDRFESGWVP